MSSREEKICMVSFQGRTNEYASFFQNLLWWVPNKKEKIVLELVRNDPTLLLH